MAMLTIQGKAVGKRKPLFADWSIPFPPEWSGDGGRRTLRDLIDQVVRAEVQAFRQRQEERQTFRALTSRQIDQAAERGKVDSGGSEVPLQSVDEDDAVTIACQALEDGLYFVVIDDENYQELDREIHVREDSRVTFVRLTLLAGG